MKKFFSRWITLFFLAAKQLYQEQYTYRAAGLAFATLFALVPLVSIIVSVITFFPFFTDLTLLAQTYIFNNFLPGSSTIIQQYLQNFINQASQLPIIEIIFLAFAALTLIIMVEHTLNAIWSAPKRHKKFTPLLIYWAVLLSSPLFIGFSVFLSTYVFSVSWFAGTANELGLTIPLLKVLALLTNAVIFSALYIVVPNCKVKMKQGIIGGIVASVLFEATKKGFSFYLLHAQSYEVIYGTLATIPIFLLWIYLSWIVVLYGAIVSHLSGARG